MKNILVTDDDTDIGIMLKMMLEYKGYAVTVATNAGKAEAILAAGNIDFVILDMLIAGVDGTDVCRRIKSNDSLAQLPVIMMSALPDARQTCLEAGANDFISKPFEMREILSLISSLINNPQPVISTSS